MFGFKNFVSKKIKLKKEIMEVELVKLDAVLKNLRAQDNVLKVGAQLRTPRTALVVVTYKVVTE